MMAITLNNFIQMIPFLNRWRRAACFCAIVLSAAGYSHPARSAPLQCTITGADTIDFGTVAVPRDVPVGAPLGTAQTSTVSVSCPANPAPSGSPNHGFYLQFYPKLTASAVPGVWNTGMDGVGLRVIDVTYDNQVLSEISRGRWSDFGEPITKGSPFRGWFTFTYRLIKTVASAAQGGELCVPSFMTLVSHNIPDNVTSPPQVTYSVGNSTIRSATCSVTTAAIDVALPSVEVGELSPVGTAAGNTPFRIGLSCGGGANVYVTLTDATNPGNTSQNLTLASGSTASGVVLRVLNADGTIVSYGPDSAAAGNTHQWLVGPSGSTNSIPLTVQYFATGTVGAGTVKGLATFTMSYQ